MTSRHIKYYLLLTLLIVTTITCSQQKNRAEDSDDSRIISYIANPQEEEIALYWKNDSNNVIGSISRLKKFVEGKNRKLVFAMNGGMYDKKKMPVGLFVNQEGTIAPLNRNKGEGNFYMKPNGVFYLTAENKAVVCQVEEYTDILGIRYATQSGPMLVIDGDIHPAFSEDSKNVHIRNGVGILPDGKVIFAMSKEKLNFYEFASFFKNMECKNALYLDGYVSRMYLPSMNWEQTDGEFGVIIAVTESQSY